MNINHLSTIIEQDNACLLQLYTLDQLSKQKERYLQIGRSFFDAFAHDCFEFFSSPGRCEIGGNHTDHNHGKVLATSINLDCIAAAAPNHLDQVRIISETYQQNITIDLNDLASDHSTSGTVPLVKGILAGFKHFGFAINGFDAYLTSDVIGAAGISSSAAFEMLLCAIINFFFNDSRCNTVDYAHIGQFAENHYWNKASGLMDQMACAVGGLISIDFKDASNPEVTPINFSFKDMNHDLIIVNTSKKGHGDLGPEYSSIPDEMKQVARFFGHETLREVSEQDVLDNIPSLRSKVSDRAILRALHFFEENRTVDKEVQAIDQRDYAALLSLITQSGNSSWKWLQNCFVPSRPDQQPIPLALALTELYCQQIKAGACRIHGGGFAGVIMVVLPQKYTEHYVQTIEQALGEHSAYIMNIRAKGAVHLDF